MDPGVQKLIAAFESKGWKYIGPADTAFDWSTFVDKINQAVLNGDQPHLSIA